MHIVCKHIQQRCYPIMHSPIKHYIRLEITFHFQIGGEQKYSRSELTKRPSVLLTLSVSFIIVFKDLKKPLGHKTKRSLTGIPSSASSPLNKKQSKYQYDLPSKAVKNEYVFREDFHCFSRCVWHTIKYSRVFLRQKHSKIRRRQTICYETCPWKYLRRR